MLKQVKNKELKKAKKNYKKLKNAKKGWLKKVKKS